MAIWHSLPPGLLNKLFDASVPEIESLPKNIVFFFSPPDSKQDQEEERKTLYGTAITTLFSRLIIYLCQYHRDRYHATILCILFEIERHKGGRKGQKVI